METKFLGQLGEILTGRIRNIDPDDIRISRAELADFVGIIDSRK